MIAGHSVQGVGIRFNNLSKIKMGAKIEIISKDKLRTYEVSKLYDVAATQVEILEQHKDQPKKLTLFTCDNYNPCLLYTSYSVGFVESFDLELLDRKLSEDNYDFVYLVHNETSVGILNDLDKITEIVKEKHNKVLAVDAVSAVGAIKYSYRNVDYVACSSGKAFCSVAGLAVVGSNCELVPLDNTPLYFCLLYTSRCV